MKKLLSLVLSLVILTSTCLNTYATPIKNFDEQQAPNYYSTKNIQARKETEKKIHTFLNSFAAPKIITRGSGANKLRVRLVKQENNYYCGPATAKMVLNYVVSKNYSQSSLARDMNTTSSNGTYVYELCDRLNQDINNNQYQYVGTWESNFSNSLVYSINQDRPVPCQVRASSLPEYGSGWGGHWVLVTGYQWGSSGSSSASNVYYNDPNYDSRYYGAKSCTVNQMINAIDDQSGYYIRAE